MANIEVLERHLAETTAGQQLLKSSAYIEARNRASEVGWLRNWVFNLRNMGIATLVGIAGVVVPGILQRYGYTNNAYGRWASGAMDLTQEAVVNAANSGYNSVMNPGITWRQRALNAWNAIRGVAVDAPMQRGHEIDARNMAGQLPAAATLFNNADPGANAIMNAINFGLQNNRGGTPSVRAPYRPTL